MVMAYQPPFKSIFILSSWSKLISSISTVISATIQEYKTHRRMVNVVDKWKENNFLHTCLYDTRIQ